MRFWIEEIEKLVPYRGYYDLSEANRGRRHSKRVETMRQKLTSFQALQSMFLLSSVIGNDELKIGVFLVNMHILTQLYQ